jgi:hypothetical protein
MKYFFAKGYSIVNEVSKGSKKWDALFNDGVKNFFDRYNQFIQIHIYAKNDHLYHQWSSYITTKIRFLITSLDNIPGVEIHPYGNIFKDENYSGKMYVGVRSFVKGNIIDYSSVVQEFIMQVGRREGCGIEVGEFKGFDHVATAAAGGGGGGGGGNSSSNSNSNGGKKKKKSRNNRGRVGLAGEQGRGEQGRENEKPNVAAVTTGATEKSSKEQGRPLDENAKVRDSIMTPTKKTKRER